MASKAQKRPVAASSPCEPRHQRSREQQDSSPESPADRSRRSRRRSSSSSSCSSSSETDPCLEGSALEDVDDISRSLSNNVSISSPRPRRHSAPSSELPDYSPQSPDQPRDARWPLWLFMVLVIAILALVFGFLFSARSSAPAIGSSQKASGSLSDAKVALHEHFPAQPNASWATFAAELRPLLRAPEASTRPGIVLLVGAPKSPTLACLVRRLSGLAASLLGDGSCRTVANEAGEEEAVSEEARKLAMDQEVRSAYDRGERCFVLNHLELLSPAQLLLMHAWCDGDHSPMKRAFLFLVLRTNESVANDGAVEQLLLNAWGGKVGDDEAGALNTRLANSIVAVREEKDLQYERSCVNNA